MVKYIYRTSLILFAAAATLLSSCNKSDDETPEGTTYFEFAETDLDIKKTDGNAELKITWTRTTQRSATLELYVDVAGLPDAAAETDYSIDTKTVTFGNGETEKTIKVNVLPALSGDKSLRLVMKSSTAPDVMLGNPDKKTNICLITLLDE